MFPPGPQPASEANACLRPIHVPRSKTSSGFCCFISRLHASQMATAVAISRYFAFRISFLWDKMATWVAISSNALQPYGRLSSRLRRPVRATSGNRLKRPKLDQVRISRIVSPAPAATATTGSRPVQRIQNTVKDRDRVGQDGILRGGWQPPPSRANVRVGRLPIGRSLPSCPQQRPLPCVPMRSASGHFARQSRRRPLLCRAAPYRPPAPPDPKLR